MDRRPENENGDVRMILVGTTGSGKSAAGNTILGRRAFQSAQSPIPVTSECQKETVEFDGQTVAVVDTPDLLHPRNQEGADREIFRFITFTSPGPHVFLVVIQLKRFLAEEQTSVRVIQEIFGERALAYTMVLFTHGDHLEADRVSAEEFINESPDLHAFISRFGGGYHVFNNNSNDRSQVRELLEKINLMVQRNGGSVYTNDLFRQAERAIREEMIHLRRQYPDIDPGEARRRAERNNSFLLQRQNAGIFGEGAAVGAAAGIVGTVLVFLSRLFR